jgi:transglutaminase/protease-like cytokinesis protein 3
MHENIAYDYDGFVNRRNVDVTPEGVFRNGKTVCSGYSRLYKYL